VVVRTKTRAAKPADISSLRMLRRARDRIDRDYAEQIGIPAPADAGNTSLPEKDAPPAAP
jgi:hypothetical protein